MTPFGMVEKAVKQIIESDYPDAEDRVGGDFAYEPGGTPDFYIQIALIPGGSSDELEGEWAVDIDVFSSSYATAMRVSLDLETVFLKRIHRADEMRLDRTYQNSSPAERPWDDDGVHRIGSTYVFTARRSG